MGSIITRFRRQTSPKEKLEKLDKSIKSLEQYHFSTEQRQKHLIGAFVVYSILLYIISFVIFYFIYFPKEWQKQVLYAVPLLIFPVLVYFAKKFLHWYFNRKIKGNDIKLIKLRNDKKQILEKVMETETYKVAKELLDKFDAEKQNKPDSTSKLKQTAEEIELRKRTNSARGVPPNRAHLTPANGAAMLSAVPTPRSYPMNAKSPALARPILPKDRGVADRIVEYLIGDGPNNRYALICRRCNSHNGMALKEEFVFIAFRCCYCQYQNPARKQRPYAPKLPESPQLTPLLRRKLSVDKTTSEKAESGWTTEEEVMSDPEEKKVNETDNKPAVNSIAKSKLEEEEKSKEKESETTDDIKDAN